MDLHRVLDLSSLELLEELGLPLDKFASVDPGACQRIGGAVAWLEHDGLLVPSARCNGTNLVIYPTSQLADAEFEVVEVEETDI